MLYYQVTGKKQEDFKNPPVLSDFYNPSQNQKNGELSFIFLGTGIGTFLLYKYKNI